MRNRQDEIRKKGFDLTSNRNPEQPIAYGKIKVGNKTIDDAVLNLGSLRKGKRHYADKRLIFRALYDKDLPLLREISNYFYKVSGIYQRTCNYVAYLYRYDWYTVPEIFSDTVKEEKVLTEFNEMLDFLDNSHIKKKCGDIALSVIKDGAYYGYISSNDSDGIIIQDLPINYCRSRYNIGNSPAVEFNMRFFDDNFRDINYRMKVLKMFPKDFQQGYSLFKQGKLEPDYLEEQYGSWYLLDPECAIKFNLNGNDIPLFISSIPAILDLDEAQDLDRRKTMQQLLKIVIQKLPLDKNGDLIFDVDEARDIHNNAVEMLSAAIGVDVLTTFADVDVEDLADSNTSTTSDDLEKVERTVYNTMGISRNLFNTDGNLSLEKSILNDESTMRDLLLQFHILFDKIVQARSQNKRKYVFHFYMLETTQYNYKEVAKLYKEQVQIGYSKMLPQIALGHSQSSIIHTAHFENEVLHLSELMIPPLQSSTLNADGLAQLSGKTTGDSASTPKSDTGGRPEKEEGQKSDKTLQNEESKS